MASVTEGAGLAFVVFEQAFVKLLVLDSRRRRLFRFVVRQRVVDSEIVGSVLGASPKFRSLWSQRMAHTGRRATRNSTRTLGPGRAADGTESEANR